MSNKKTTSIQRFTTVNVYDVIAQAAQTTRLLTITYIDSKGQVSSRTVEPYEVKDGKLYAFCHKAQNIRAFKLDHIQQAVLEAHTYQPRFPILM